MNWTKAGPRPLQCRCNAAQRAALDQPWTSFAAALVRTGPDKPPPFLPSFTQTSVTTLSPRSFLEIGRSSFWTAVS